MLYVEIQGFFLLCVAGRTRRALQVWGTDERLCGTMTRRLCQSRSGVNVPPQTLVQTGFLSFPPLHPGIHQNYGGQRIAAVLAET